MADLKTKITIQVDAKEAGSSLSQLAAEFKKVTEEFKKPLGQIDAFANLKKSLSESKTALDEARAKVSDLARQMKDAGTPSKELAAAFEKAKSKAGELKDKVAEQQTALQQMRNAMSAAGVNVTKLASEEVRLKKSLEEATAAFQKNRAVASARDDLGLKSTQQLRTEIDRLKASYNTLKSSGTLSMRELGEAKLRLNQRIQELKTSNNGLVESFERARFAIVGLVTAAAGIKTALTASKDLETAMSDMAKVVDAPTGKIEELRQRFLALSREMPLTAIELARIAEAGGQMGIAANDIEQFVIIVSKMATAFKMTAEDAGTATGKIMNLYGLNLPGVQKLADAVNILGNNTNAVERDILNVITRTGGMAKIFGLTAEQASALGTAFLSLGRTPETASMAISAMLSKLQTAPAAGKEFREALDGIGIDAKQLAAEIEANPQAALVKFLETLKTLEKQDLSQTLVKLFGLEYQDDIAILVTGLDQYKEAIGLVADETKAAGAVDQEYQRGLKTLNTQLQLMKNAFTELWVNLGDTLLPIAKAIVQWLTSVAQTIAEVVKAAPGLSAAILGLGTLAASFGALRAIALAVNLVFATFITTLGNIVGAFALAFTGLTAFQAALVGLGGALVTTIAIDRIVELTKTFKEYLDLQKQIGTMSESYRKAAGEFKDFKDVKVKGLEELRRLGAEQLQEEYEGLQKAMSYWNRYRAALETQANEREWGGLFQTDAAKAAEAELPKVSARIEELQQALVSAKQAADANGVSLVDFRERARAAADTARQTGAVFERDLRQSFDAAKESVKVLAKEHQRSSKAIGDHYELQAEKAKAAARDEKTANQSVLEIYRQKKDALIQAAEDTAGKQDEVLKASKASEKEYAEEAKKIAEQLRDDKIKAIESYQDKLKSALIQALNDEKKYAAEVRKLQNDLRTAQTSYQEKVRELARKTMTEEQAWLDKKKEALETERAAREALSKAAAESDPARQAEGYQEAIDLAKKAQQEAQGLAVEIKDGEKTLLSMQQGVNEATRIMSTSQDTIEQAIRKQTELAQKNQQEARNRADAFQKEIDTLTEAIRKVNETPIEPKCTIEVDSREVDAKLRELDGTVTHSTHVIDVETRGGGSGRGGSAGYKYGDSDTYEGSAAEKYWMEYYGFRLGGLIRPIADLVARASRPIRRFAQGGFNRIQGALAGWGGGDRIRALLEAGEFVIRKEAVAKYGAGFFELLNNMKLNLPSVIEAIATPPQIPRHAYAEGGPVIAAASGSGAPSETITWRWQLNDKEYPLTLTGPRGTASLMRELEKELGRAGLTRSRT